MIKSILKIICLLGLIAAGSIFADGDAAACPALSSREYMVRLAETFVVGPPRCLRRKSEWSTGGSTGGNKRSCSIDSCDI